MNIGALGTGISVLTTVLFVIGGLITIRTRRLSTEAKELRELREMNRAAMSYIYDLEMAIDEVSRRSGIKLAAMDKPEILKRSYLEQKAQESGNPEIQGVLDIMQEIRNRHPALSQDPPP